MPEIHISGYLLDEETNKDIGSWIAPEDSPPKSRNSVYTVFIDGKLFKTIQTKNMVDNSVPKTKVAKERFLNEQARNPYKECDINDPHITQIMSLYYAVFWVNNSNQEKKVTYCISNKDLFDRYNKGMNKKGYEILGFHLGYIKHMLKQTSSTIKFIPGLENLARNYNKKLYT